MHVIKYLMYYISSKCVKLQLRWPETNQADRQSFPTGFPLCCVCVENAWKWLTSVDIQEGSKNEREIAIE